jgi:chloramphenicol 3-O phosphotransferase
LLSKNSWRRLASDRSRSVTTRTEPAGTVIFLNGTSSSGKSSIAAELQRTLERPFLVWDSDGYRRLWGGRAPKAPDGMRTARMGFHACIAALASVGNNVIVDSILRTDEHRSEMAGLLSEVPAYLIGVQCPLEELERRERDRGDRRVGIARSQFDEVHAHGVYDLEVDTSTMTPSECARRIREHIECSPQPSAFASLLGAARPRGVTL